MSKSKKRALTIILVLLLIAATVVICYYLFRKQQEPDPLYDNNATIGVLPGIDIDERRKQLQDMLDKSVIAFSINTSPVFLNGTSEGNLLIENPGNNAKLLQVRILINDSEEEIYASKYIKPGSYIENVKLDKVLEKGVYDATAYFSAYDEETTEFIGQTGAQITLTVEN